MNPTEEEVLGYVETLRNWDRWGPDDELGTLNFHYARETCRRRSRGAERDALFRWRTI